MRVVLISMLTAQTGLTWLMAGASGGGPRHVSLAAQPISAPIVLEDATANCGVSWLVVPKDRRDVQPGKAYCGWQFDASLLDIDGDGHLDLLSVVHHASEAAPGGIWLGRGNGTFGPNLMDRCPVRDETGAKVWLCSGYGVGVDVNGDGCMDFYVSEPGGLYVNQGFSGQGEQRTAKFVRHPLPGFRACIFSDFNADGNLDCFTNATMLLGVGNGSLPRQWKENGHFLAQLKQWDAHCRFGAVHQAVSADFDRDGSVDLLVNPSLPAPGKGPGVKPRTLLFLNEGKGNFTESAQRLGLAAGPPQGPLVAADLNNDGFLDAVVAGRGSGADDLTRKIVLYVNEGGRRFVPRGAADCGLRIKDTDDYNIVYCSGIAADLDNDGLLDVVIGDALAGYRVFHNRGEFQFDEVTVLPPAARMARPAAADLDEDGMMDLVLNEGKQGLTIYLNRTRNDNGWLEVVVKGPAGNRNGAGALVEVFQAGKLGDRSAHVGTQHVTAESDNHVPITPHFGLGCHDRVDVRVTLPGGRKLEAASVRAKTRMLADFPAGRIVP